MLIGLLKRLAVHWHDLVVERYDPAKHYMRGPGPKCAQKRAAPASAYASPAARLTA